MAGPRKYANNHGPKTPKRDTKSISLTYFWGLDAGDGAEKPVQGHQPRNPGYAAVLAERKTGQQAAKAFRPLSQQH